MESVVAGRVRELVFPGRSRVEVTLADGSVVVETAVDLPVPLPGWRRWARVVEHEPYDAASP